jgi:hypothetical protein
MIVLAFFYKFFYCSLLFPFSHLPYSYKLQIKFPLFILELCFLMVLSTVLPLYNAFNSSLCFVLWGFFSLLSFVHWLQVRCSNGSSPLWTLHTNSKQPFTSFPMWALCIKLQATLVLLLWALHFDLCTLTLKTITITSLVGIVW